MRATPSRLSSADGETVLNSIKRLAKGICDRNTGIGADGILVLHSEQRGELTPHGLTIINSDGSLAKNCGNGQFSVSEEIHRALEGLVIFLLN